MIPVTNSTHSYLTDNHHPSHMATLIQFRRRPPRPDVEAALEPAAGIPVPVTRSTKSITGASESASGASGWCVSRIGDPPSTLWIRELY